MLICGGLTGDEDEDEEPPAVRLAVEVAGVLSTAVKSILLIMCVPSIMDILAKIYLLSLLTDLCPDESMITSSTSTDTNSASNATKHNGINDDGDDDDDGDDGPCDLPCPPGK